MIYVGKAKNLKKRVSQYFFRKQDHIKVRNMVNNVVDFDFFVVNNEVEALALENNLIKKYKPYYKQNLKLALPVILSQMGQITVQLADTAMVGNYGGNDPVLSLRACLPECFFPLLQRYRLSTSFAR